MKRRILAPHAIAQLAGFAWPWWRMEPDPYTEPTPNGPMLSGDAAMLVMSCLWLLVAAVFVVVRTPTQCGPYPAGTSRHPRIVTVQQSRRQT